jgi:hypothetical protein
MKRCKAEVREIRPFSNGTEAMEWYHENCCQCVRAYFPGEKKNGEQKDYPCQATMERYVRSGKECKLKFYIDLAFISGTIPEPIAEEIGYGPDVEYPQYKTLPWECKKFSDEDDDRFKPPPGPVRPSSPPPGDIRQLSIFPLTFPFLPSEKQPVNAPLESVYP